MNGSETLEGGLAESEDADTGGDEEVEVELEEEVDVKFLAPWTDLKLSNRRCALPSVRQSPRRSTRTSPSGVQSCAELPLDGIIILDIGLIVPPLLLPPTLLLLLPPLIIL